MGIGFHRATLVPRAASGAGGLLLADVILGMGAFSVITLGSLWYFCLGWIRLQAEYAALGRPFGAGWQLDLAYVGFFVTLPSVVVTVYLAIQAFDLPKRLLRRAVSDPTP